MLVCCYNHTATQVDTVQAKIIIKPCLASSHSHNEAQPEHARKGTTIDTRRTSSSLQHAVRLVWPASPFFVFSSASPTGAGAAAAMVGLLAFFFSIFLWALRPNFQSPATRKKAQKYVVDKQGVIQKPVRVLGAAFFAFLTSFCMLPPTPWKSGPCA